VTAAGGDFTTASATIGRRIWQDALWHEGRCNWVGAEPIQRDDNNRPLAATYRSLGPDLYSGTSGVALFLGELAALTGEPGARQAARGAIRHALAHTEDVPPSSRLGLFTGWAGVAYAAFRVGALIGEAEWQECALALARRCASEPASRTEFDIISGAAGAIASLVPLFRATGQAVLLDTAVRLADALVESAVHDRAGCSWPSPGAGTIRNLTGFSHGTAGTAYALGEIFTATGDDRYRKTALLALDYERHWFSAKEGNWPDFRKDPFGDRRTRNRPFSFATFWCHGAPGIAISRLRAYECLGEETCREEASIALSTTRKAVRSALHTGTWNYSLCHGLAGNAEALLEATRVTDPESDENAGLCRAVAGQGIERHVSSANAWPCGTHTGETPGLMLGLAGIGLFYLRLENPSVPSVLILRSTP
jgi:type 2 lantibiotic biosynthesis protein LanM